MAQNGAKKADLGAKDGHPGAVKAYNKGVEAHMEPWRVCWLLVALQIHIT
jgi:hypothetical protein